MLAALFLAAIVAPGFAAEPTAEFPVNAVAVPASGPTRILIQPRAGAGDDEVDNAVRAHGGRRVEKIGPINVHVIELPAQVNPRAVEAVLKRNKHFKFVEIDEASPPGLTTNDPKLSSQWHLSKISAPTAWDTGTGNDVVIAILDSGVDARHPDLAGQLVPGWNVYDSNNNTTDVQGHGTGVAGTAAAAGNNAIGVASVAYRAKIMPVRISDANAYASFSNMAKGIIWAADHDARVVNLSYENVAKSSSVASAAQYLRNKGGVTVVCAGNSNLNTSAPTNGSIIFVSATDRYDVKTSFSNYGTHIGLAAPGAGILTTARGGGYGSMSGTSFSSPIVAGTVALMMAANPSLSPAQLQSVLYSTAVDLGAAGRDNYYGAGRVNAARAIVAAKQAAGGDTQAPSVALSGPAEGSTVSGIVPIDVSASDNVGVTRVELLVNGSTYAVDTTPPYAFSWDTSKTTATTVSLRAYAYDAAGNYTASPTTTVTISAAQDAPDPSAQLPADTTAPTVSMTYPTSGAVVSGTITVTGKAQDNVGVASMRLAVDGRVFAASTGGTFVKQWNTSNLPTGAHSLTLTAIDASGNATTTAATQVTITR